jgi:hypothetical protein
VGTGIDLDLEMLRLKANIHRVNEWPPVHLRDRIFRYVVRMVLELVGAEIGGLWPTILPEKYKELHLIP